MTDGRPPARKTYSRLATSRRMPTEYEVVSTDLHYNYPDGFELTDTPVIDWYRRHREGSKLCSTDWGTFADPRRTTYRSYTELQDRKEDVIDGLLRQVDDEAYDDELSEGWVDFLDRWYAPLRFPVAWPADARRVRRTDGAIVAGNQLCRFSGGRRNAARPAHRISEPRSWRITGPQLILACTFVAGKMQTPTNRCASLLSEL